VALVSVDGGVGGSSFGFSAAGGCVVVDVSVEGAVVFAVSVGGGSVGCGSTGCAGAGCACCGGCAIGRRAGAAGAELGGADDIIGGGVVPIPTCGAVFGGSAAGFSVNAVVVSALVPVMGGSVSPGP
jgi:hypothetical protein